MEPDWTAIATLALALVTVALAWQVRGQTAAARAADIARQREVHILALRPRLLRNPTIVDSPTGMPDAIVPAVIEPNFLVLDLTVKLRGRSRESAPLEYAVERGAVTGDVEMGGTSVDLRLELRDFVDLETRLPWGGKPFEIVASYRGILGQSVVETYEWDYTAQRQNPGGGPRIWRLTRLEVDPRGVPGADRLDLRFGAPLTGP